MDSNPSRLSLQYICFFRSIIPCFRGENQGITQAANLFIVVLFPPPTARVMIQCGLISFIHPSTGPSHTTLREAPECQTGRTQRELNWIENTWKGDAVVTGVPVTNTPGPDGGGEKRQIALTEHLWPPSIGFERFTHRAEKWAATCFNFGPNWGVYERVTPPGPFNACSIETDFNISPQLQLEPYKTFQMAWSSAGAIRHGVAQTKFCITVPAVMLHPPSLAVDCDTTEQRVGGGAGGGLCPLHPGPPREGPPASSIPLWRMCWACVCVCVCVCVCEITDCYMYAHLSTQYVYAHVWFLCGLPALAYVTRFLVVLTLFVLCTKN